LSTCCRCARRIRSTWRRSSSPTRSPSSVSQSVRSKYRSSFTAPTLAGSRGSSPPGRQSAGLFWDHVLRKRGAGRIIAIDPIVHRLEAGRRYGVDDTIDVTGKGAEDAVMDLTGGSGADLVIEAVGSTETLNQAFRLVRQEGQVVLFGLPEKVGTVPFDYDAWFRKRASAYTRLGSQDEPGLASYREAFLMGCKVSAITIWAERVEPGLAIASRRLTGP
jgi:hypothetical protein